MQKDRILITSALPYVNGIPHLGHLAGCLLPSDVFARFNRLIGNQVLYIAGTDEHGSPCEIGAKKENVSVEEYTSKYHNIHKAKNTNKKSHAELIYMAFVFAEG